MKQFLRYTLTIVALLCITTYAWAGKVRLEVYSSPSHGGYVYANSENKNNIGTSPSDYAESSYKVGGNVNMYRFAKAADGYTFEGWADTDGGTPNSWSSTVSLKANIGASTKTYKYYAIFAPITYTIAFNGNGSTSGTMSNMAMVYNTAKNLNANVFSRQYAVTYDADGGTSSTNSASATYSFVGWAKSPTASVEFSDKQSVSNLTTNANAVVTLYAQWKSASVVLPNATKAGAVIDGWYAGGVKVGEPGDNYTPTANVTLTAKWIEKYTPEITGNNYALFVDGEQLNAFSFKYTDNPTAHIQMVSISEVNDGSGKVISYDAKNNKIIAYNAGKATIYFTQQETETIKAGTSATYTITVSKHQTSFSGESYSMLVDGTQIANYSYTNTSAAQPSASNRDSFYYTIDEENFANEELNKGTDLITFNPSTKQITACNAGTAKITLHQKETYKYIGATSSYNITVNKHTPKFTWNAANTPYYYGTSIPNIFYTTNTDIETTFTSDNEAFARVENNTLYIANARETATITVSQPENYKWYSNSEQYVIAPVNGNNHVPFTITSENYYNVFRYDNTGNLSWKNDGVLLGSPNVGSGAFDYDDRYYDIVFTGVPDKLSFTYERSTTIASDCDWYVKESVDGVTWSKNNVWEKGDSNSGSVEVQLNPTTHYLRFCYSGNYGGYFRNIHVTERFQFEATPTAIDFGSEGITYGMQSDTVFFLHANAGRITKAVITGADAKYFNVTPELIPGTGRDCFGNAALEVTFDNLGEDRGATPYNATLVISDNSDKTEDIHIPLTGIRDGKSTADIIWNPNALPYYFNTTIANIAYSTNRDANCPLTFTTSDATIAEVIGSDLRIYGKGQEVTITVTQPGNADYMPATESFTFTPCERPSLEVPFRVSQALHAKSVQLGTKSGWYENDNQIRIASTSIGDGFIWGDDRKRVLITFAGMPDKLYFEYSSSDAATPELTPEFETIGWEVEESPNGTDWNTVWKTGSLSASWKSSGEIDLSPKTQYIRFSYKGNFAGYLRNIIISSLEGNNYLRAEEGGYLSRGAKWGTQAVVDPFGMVCRVSHFTVDNTNIYTRLQFVDNMQYLYETADTKEIFTDAETADNPAYLWQINSNASGKFTVQSANDLGNGNRGNYFTIIDNTLSFTSDPAQATVWDMETPAEHNIVVRKYMDAAAAKAAEKDFGSDINTLKKVRSNLYVQDFEIDTITVPGVALAEQTGEYRDGINGTFAVYDTIISGLKPGFYRLTVKALYRIAEPQNAHAAKANNWESVLAYIYANDVKYPIQSVYTSNNLGSYDTSDDIYNGSSYPAQLNSAKKAFEEVNRYLNDVYVYVEADPGQETGTLRYGIKNPSYVPGAWLAYSTITLTHFGRKEYIFQGKDNQNPIDWNTAANWNRNDVPNKYHNVRIEANVNISSPVEVFGVTIDPNYKLHITSTETSTGGLTVGAQGIQGATTDGSSIVIDNLKTGAGFLRISPAYQGTMPRATINYQTRSTLDTGANKDATWQYIGAPGDNCQFTVDYITWLYQWSEPQNWLKKTGTLTLTPFAGYAITQYGQPIYSLKADPICTNQTITLTKTPEASGGMNGDNLFANSYMAPIDVKNFTADDFSGDLDKTFYIFNSGSWNQWNGQNEKDSTLGSNGSTTPGQYCAIPALSAKYLDSEYDITTIPPMQGVYVIANKDGASIRLDYNKHIWQAGTDSDASTNLNEPMRAPQRQAQEQMQQDDFRRLRLQVNSANSGADRMYIIQESTTTRDYDNGYDAPNQFAEGIANIYTTEPFGKMEVSCANNIDSMYIGFQAGADNYYTLSFRSLIGDSLYLKDMEQNTIIRMEEGAEYCFSATPFTTNDLRFLLLLHPQWESDNTPTQVDQVQLMDIWNDNTRLYITNAPTNSIATIYTISGQPILHSTIQYTTHTIDIHHLPQGVYILRINNQIYKFVCQ